MPAEGSKIDGGQDNGHNAVDRVLLSEKKLILSDNLHPLFVHMV